MIKMVVSEKAIAGKSIADILAGASVPTTSSGSAQVFRFKSGNDEYVVVPLRGHITDVEFPKKYSYWLGTDLKKLIDAQIDYVGKEAAIISALKKIGKDANEVIIATDADREGESIGVEALNYIKETNPKIKAKRAYFSAITKKDINDAEAKVFFASASKLLKPHGYLVTYDGVYIESQSKIAKFILSRDRGQYVRTPEGYTGLAKGIFSEIKFSIIHDMYRIPFTGIIMKCYKH